MSPAARANNNTMVIVERHDAVSLPFTKKERCDKVHENQEHVMASFVTLSIMATIFERLGMFATTSMPTHNDQTGEYCPESA